MNDSQKSSLSDRIPARVWLLISFLAAMLLWYVLSIIPATSRAFPNVVKVVQSIGTMIDRGVLWKDLSSSLISVISGYAAGVCHRPAGGHPDGWYKPVRYVIEPWIQFIRNIPPPGVCAADRHRGGRGTQAPDHRHHHRLFPHHVRHDLPGRHQRG